MTDTLLYLQLATLLLIIAMLLAQCWANLRDARRMVRDYEAADAVLATLIARGRT